MADPDSLSRIELISVYINQYYSLDSEGRARFEAEFRKRKLPLPCMPATYTIPARTLPAMDRDCFLSYLLLIFTGTAIFYSWIFLAQRLVKMDFAKAGKHRLIQSGIALFYVLCEILLFEHLSAL